MEDSDTVFDRVLHSVGDDGKYQKRTNVIFTFFLGMFSTMGYVSILLAVAMPEHWCHVPGKDKGNYTVKQWKNMTIPRFTDSLGIEKYSSCEMYEYTNATIGPEVRELPDNTTACQFGYEYDTTWYVNTVPSLQNWVCDKNLYTSNILAAGKLGEVFGVLIFGYIGDILGRRPAFLISLATVFVGRFVSAFVTDWYLLFLAASALATMSCTTPAQACIVIMMEISPAEDRAFLVQLQNIAWMTGLCMLPLFGWLSGDTVVYIIATTVPLLAFFPLSLYLVESPRWLLSRGRVAESLKQLKIIAKVNGTRLSPDSALMLQNSFTAPEKVYGVASLFSSWRLAKNTCLMTLSWACCYLSYNTLILNITNMGGNPFLNFFLQSVAELPAYLIGKVLCDWLGRRFTGAVGFLLSALGLIPIIMMLDDTNTVWIQSILLVGVKSLVSVTYFVCSLQSLEIYPTNVRQSGVSLGMWSGNIASIIAPYIVFVGVSHNARFPYIVIMVICVLGIIMELFLPETLHERLPETLQEAETFGKDQQYWRIPRKHKDLYVLANMKMPKRHNIEHYDPEDN